MKKINVLNGLYDIVIDKDFSNLWQCVNEIKASDAKICVVSDSNVAPIYMDNIKEILKTNYSFVIPAGEENKTLENVKSIYVYLIENKFDRHDLIVALGGGVIGDLVGYTAATYLRGVDFVQIPTTLLAQVDSSIGGKTGVDFDSYKNMVGAFHQPRLVYSNVNTFNSLDDRIYLSGMGEVIKHTLIRDKDAFVYLNAHVKEIKAKDFSAVSAMLDNSDNIKRVIVENDEKEQGERALLNFGHTLGHAIEKYTNFKFYHGECVALGSILASYISFKRNLISAEELDEIEVLFKKFGLIELFKNDMFNEDDINNIVLLTKNDKKMQAGKVKFILLDGIGKGFIDKTVTDDEMKDALRAYFNN